MKRSCHQRGVWAVIRGFLLLGVLVFALQAGAQGDPTAEPTQPTEAVDTSEQTGDQSTDQGTAQDGADNASDDASTNTSGDDSGDDAGKDDKDKDDEEVTPLFEQDFGQVMHTIWNATLFTAGDTEIKLNQILIALLVALLGLFIAKRISKFIIGRLVKVSKVSDIVADTIGKVVYYIGCAIVILIAMQVAGIPTTVFTVLGGALAIGVGFGAQNLFNNLISGIIILTEKPIRRRDIIVIDGMEGQVAEIGNRRTRVRTGDGIDVLVPNSTFLETNVINWTLSDDQVRGHVAVGVAYGSPVRKVKEILLKIAEEHKKVNNLPKPIVLFTEFGDNTLNFSVFFWTNVQTPMDLRQIESDLRFEIDEAFHQANITIAFPQRDIHLDTLRPLEVRMLNSSESGGKSD